MLASLQDILDTVKSNTLTYQQKLMCLGNIAERLFDPRELLGYTDEEWQFLQNQMICDLNEGYAIYRPRYILPNYNVYIKKGCEFLELPAPKDLDEALDGLLILYSHVPSITTFPVYIGRLDMLLDPFITDEEQDYIKIKRFLNHVDKTVPDSFCHANIGPYDTKAGRLILKAVIELEAPTPNMTIRYDKSKTSREFAELAAKACLLVSKPSFANDAYYISDLGEQYGIASCYNALPECGGAYTLTRLRLGTIARACKTVDEMVNELLPRVAKCALSTMDKRHKFVVEESNFFNTSFLEKEGFIKRTNFTGMFAIVVYRLDRISRNISDFSSLIEELGRLDIKTKTGRSFTRFSIKSILQNPVYLIADKDAYQYFVDNEAELFAPESGKKASPPS